VVMALVSEERSSLISGTADIAASLVQFSAPEKKFSPQSVQAHSALPVSTR
jgi:hypothetical protein